MPAEPEPTAEAVRLKKELVISGVGTLKPGTYPVREVGGEATAQHLVRAGYAAWAGKGSQAANAAAGAPSDGEESS